MSRVKRFSLALGIAVVIDLAQVFLSMPGGVQSAPPTSGIQYVDVTKASGLTFRHNSGASGKNIFPRPLGWRGVHRLQRRWLAGSVLHERQRLAGTTPATVDARTVSQQPQWHFHECHCRFRPQSRSLRNGVGSRRISITTETRICS